MALGIRNPANEIKGGRGVALSDMLYCRNCGAPIRFIDMPSGKRMPVDAACVWVYVQEDGQILFTTEGVRVTGTTDALDVLRTTPGYRPHWVSCTRPEPKKKKTEETRVVARCGLPKVIEAPKPPQKKPEAKKKSEFEQMALFTVYDEKEVLVSKAKRRSLEEEF